MSFELMRKLAAMEARIAALEGRVESLTSALALSDSAEVPERRKPGRARKDEKPASA